MLLEHDQPELQMITINYQGFTLSALYIPPATTNDNLSRALNRTQVTAMLELSDQVLGDFNMHVKGYLTPRDDARAKIVNPVMQRCQLKILNDPERPTYTRSNAQTIIDFLYSRIPATMWLIHINRISHRMISSDIKRKLKNQAKVIRCDTIPIEGFEESLHKYIAQGKTPHMTLTATLRDLLGLSKRFKPLAQIHPYDNPEPIHPM